MDAIRIVLACIKSADKKYNLINNKDRIALGISGGKDSMLLLYALTLYRRYQKMNFEIIPVNIDLGFPDSNPEPIRAYCQSLGFKLIEADGKIVYPILKKQQELQKTPLLPCSICSKMKKAIINKVALENKCNKVSFAHHKSDAIETLFLNEIYGGRIATFSPKMFLENTKLTFIRPLINLDESIIIRAVKECNIPVLPSHCPNDKHTKREDIKLLIHQINREYPSSKDNFLTMLSNYEKEDLFYNYNEIKTISPNVIYKEALKISDYYFEEDILSNKKITTFRTKITSKERQELKHIHIFKNGKIIGFILLKIENRKFTVKKYAYIDQKSFVSFLITFYVDLYNKYNPLEFIFNSNNEKLLSEFDYKKLTKTSFSISENPMKLKIKYNLK